MELNASRMAHAVWHQAWRLRCCPPEHLLTGKPDKQLNEHLQICPWCRQAKDTAPGPFPEFDAAAWNVNLEPVPGQVRALNARFAGWGPKRRYYNPPVVLILSLPDDRSVFVSQIYGDRELEGPDDVPLGNHLAGFAEPWNCHTLSRNELGLLLGEAEPGVAESVLRRCEQADSPLRAGSLAWFFRQMEVETGFFFARQSTGTLMAEASPLAWLAYQNTDALLQDLQVLPTTYDLRHDETDYENLLARTCADDRLLPLAAAEGESVPALIYTVDLGIIVAARVLTLPLSFQEYADGILTVTGSSVPLAEETLAWIFRWKIGDELIPPLPGQSGHRDTIFWAAFLLSAEQANQDGTLVVRVLVPWRQ
jgi:hypothetical protein